MLREDFITSFDMLLLTAGTLFGVFLTRLVQAIVEWNLRKGTLKLEWEQKKREQAAKVAEYFAYAWRLNVDDSPEVYRKANQLGWKLAIYLPPELYRHVCDGVNQPRNDRNILTAIVDVRDFLTPEVRGQAKLSADEIIIHSPDIGRR